MWDTHTPATVISLSVGGHTSYQLVQTIRKLRPQIATFLQIFCFKRMLRSSCPYIIQCSLEGFVWKTLQLVGR